MSGKENLLIKSGPDNKNSSIKELKKRSGKAAENFAKISEELDWSKEKEENLRNEIFNSTEQECLLIARFDEKITYYNNIADTRLKQIKKQVKQLRKKRKDALEELIKLKSRIAWLEAKCAAISYSQGEIYWDARLNAIKGRKWANDWRGNGV